MNDYSHYCFKIELKMWFMSKKAQNKTIAKTNTEISVGDLNGGTIMLTSF